MNLMEKMWGISLHAGCTFFLTTSLLNFGFETKEMFFPSPKIKKINQQELFKEVSKSIQYWKNHTFTLQEYIESKNNSNYLLPNYSPNKDSIK